MALEAVFFDLHGTLTIPGQTSADGLEWSRAAVRCFEPLGVDTSIIDLETLREELWDGGDYTAAADGTAFEHRLASFANRRFGTSFGRPDLTAAADAICAHWQSHFTLDPAATRVLGDIARVVPVGLVSNFDHPPHVHRLLKGGGLESIFTVIIISGEVGVEKPDPEILHLACRRVGVAAGECAYVGDSYVDYTAATGASMSFVWLRRDEAEKWSREHSDNRFAESDAELHRKAEAGEIAIARTLGDLPRVLLPPAAGREMGRGER